MALLLVIALQHVLLILSVLCVDYSVLEAIWVLVNVQMVVRDLVRDLVLRIVLVCLVYLSLTVELLSLHDSFLVAAMAR